MKNNICIVTFPFEQGGSGTYALTDLIDLLIPLSNDLFVISGAGSSQFFKDCAVKTLEVNHKAYKNNAMRAISYLVTQLKICIEILRLRKNVDCYIFLFGEDLTVPIVLLKLLRKKVLLVCVGSPIIANALKKEPFSMPIRYMVNTSYRLADILIVYSPKLVGEFGLDRYREKIRIARHHYIHTKDFRSVREYKYRGMVVGYLGRLSEEKGAMNFARSLPALLKTREDVRIIIGGEGPLYQPIRDYLDKNGLSDRIRMPGWIDHDRLPEFLNELKLLVIPSYTEGLPSTMLEAMACGTPVLITPVGSIPDIVNDSINGFLLKSNDPEDICNGVIEAINYPDIEKVSRNSVRFIEENFLFSNALHLLVEIFDSLAREGK